MADHQAFAATEIGDATDSAMIGANSGAVDITHWSLYNRGNKTINKIPHGQEKGEKPYLVGPVVGAVTQHDARVLVEVDLTQTVAVEAFMDDESVCAIEKEVAGRTPTVFKLHGFAPNKRIRVVMEVRGQVREARFTTPCNKRQWKIATVSCNAHNHAEELGLWEKLAKVIGNVDCIVHMGDQIYGDNDMEARRTGRTLDSAWVASLNLLEGKSKSEWADYTEEVLECYRKAYRVTWNIPYVAMCLASAANYMICDDHEFTDDLGDIPEHVDPSKPEHFIAKQAYRVYNEYQKQLLEDTDVMDESVKPYYAVKLSPRVGLYMTDNRVERSIHLDQAPEEAWENKGFLGPSQWVHMTEAFMHDFNKCDLVLLTTPTPLVFLSDKATSLAEMKIDDAKGTWGHKRFMEEQAAFCSMLTDWQNAKKNRCVLTIAGDVHLGGYTDSWHNDSKVPLHQMTASAVGNMPDGGAITGPAALAAKAAMKADQLLFPFKVQHHSWIFGPNYGMVDAILSERGHRRPKITLTLMPDDGSPKIRNLDYGSSDVDVKAADEHLAAEAAHTAAKVMNADD